MNRRQLNQIYGQRRSNKCAFVLCAVIWSCHGNRAGHHGLKHAKENKTTRLVPLTPASRANV